MLRICSIQARSSPGSCRPLNPSSSHASKQGILKKPSAAQDLAMVPYQAAQHEPEDEEASQDDVEEDEEEGCPSKPSRTTTSSSRRPRTFRRKTSTTSSRSSTRSRSSACGRSLRRAARATQEPSKPSRKALAKAQASLPGRGACSGGGSRMVESRPSSSSSPQ